MSSLVLPAARLGLARGVGVVFIVVVVELVVVFVCVDIVVLLVGVGGLVFEVVVISVEVNGVEVAGVGGGAGFVFDDLGENAVVEVLVELLRGLEGDGAGGAFAGCEGGTGEGVLWGGGGFRVSGGGVV